MHLDAILEVAIGLIMTWLFVSAATSQIQELAAELLGLRSTFLKNQIKAMFGGDEKTVEQLYNHGLIRSLETTSIFGWKRKPATIRADIFAMAAVDLFLNRPQSNAGKPLQEAIQTLAPNVAPGAMEAVGKLDEYRKNVQEWYEAAMNRASDVYRRNITFTALVIGMLLAYFFNVDTLYVANTLWTQPTSRQAIVAQAGNLSPDDEVGLGNTLARINNLSLPIGWRADSRPQSPQEWYYKYLGWFLTGFAASQGSPFWFDILRRLMGLKNQTNPVPPPPEPSQPSPVG